MFDLEKERSKVQDLHDQVEAKECKIDQLDSLCKSLKTQLQTEVGANKQHAEELEECQLSLKNSNLERDNLKNDLHEAKTENQNLKDKLHTFKKKSVESEGEMIKNSQNISLMEDKSKSLEDQLKNSEINSEEWQDKYKAAQDQIYEKSKLLKTLHDDKTRLEEDLSELKLSEETLRGEKESLKLEIYEISKYKNEAEILKKEKDRLSDKADALWKEVKDHQDLIHASEKEHLDLRRELEAQIRSKEEECNQLKSQLKTSNSTENTSESESPNDCNNSKIPLIKKPSKESKVPRKKVLTTKKSTEEKVR